jgi:hypothetical protein
MLKVVMVVSITLQSMILLTIVNFESGIFISVSAKVGPNEVQFRQVSMYIEM